MTMKKANNPKGQKYPNVVSRSARLTGLPLSISATTSDYLMTQPFDRTAVIDGHQDK